MYIFNDGFRLSFGDYYKMDIDEQGITHFIFGEGYDTNAPGSIWYFIGQQALTESPSSLVTTRRAFGSGF